MTDNMLELYEKKVVKDDDFPAQVQTHVFQTEGWRFTRHWHEHIEIRYVLDGSGSFHVGQKRYEAEKGTLIIANSNELHWGSCKKAPFVEYVLIFCMDAFSKELDAQNLVFCNAIHDDPQIHNYMQSIWQELQQEQPGSKTACKAILTQMIVYLRRNYVEQTLTNEESSHKKQELERMTKIVEYIEQHYTEPITNQELADLLFLSKGRFEHLFRENMGVPPLQYINELRVKKAMNLIKGSDSSLSEIAAAVGFGDYNYFGRLFRRYYGRTPKEAQQQLKRAELYE